MRVLVCFPLQISLGIVQKQHYAYEQAVRLSIQKWRIMRKPFRFFRQTSMQVFESITLKETFAFEDDIVLRSPALVNEHIKTNWSVLDAHTCLFPLHISLGVVQKQHYAYKQAVHLSTQKWRIMKRPFLFFRQTSMKVFESITLKETFPFGDAKDYL